MAMLKHGPARTWPNELGSGTAIGVAIIFPMLMLLIVCLQMLSEAARIEQSVQAAANRSARTASLCCYHTGGPGGAEEVARASLSAAETANTFNQVHCNNDYVGSSEVVFIDVNGNHVPNDPDAGGNYRAVPPGGTVHVFVTCRIPPQILGGYGIPGLDADRTAEGVATVDPYRFRPGA